MDWLAYVLAVLLIRRSKRLPFLVGCIPTGYHNRCTQGGQFGAMAEPIPTPLSPVTNATLLQNKTLSKTTPSMLR